MLEVKSTRPPLVGLHQREQSAFMEEENDDKNPWWFSVYRGFIGFFFMFNRKNIHLQEVVKLFTLSETNSSTLKIGGKGRRCFSFGFRPIFRCFSVS